MIKGNQNIEYWMKKKERKENASKLEEIGRQNHHVCVCTLC